MTSAVTGDSEQDRGRPLRPSPWDQAPGAEPPSARAAVLLPSGEARSGQWFERWRRRKTHYRDVTWFSEPHAPAPSACRRLFWKRHRLQRERGCRRIWESKRRAPVGLARGAAWDELLGFQSGALRGPQVSVPAAPKIHGGRFGGEREPVLGRGSEAVETERGVGGRVPPSPLGRSRGPGRYV